MPIDANASDAVPTALDQAGAILNRGRSHWWNMSSPYAPSEPLRADIKVDCCIVGGGVNGVSAAYHLKMLDASISVALLEAEVVGFGASGRNAGQLLVKIGGASLDKLVQKHGPEKIGAAWNYVHRGIALIENLPAEEGVSCDYAPTGTLYPSLGVDGDYYIEKTLDLIDKIGQSKYNSYIGSGQIEKELSSPYLGSAIYESRGGQFNPLKLMRGLRCAAERHGAEIFEYSSVARIIVEPTHITVHSGAGSVRCKKLILATNAYTHLLNNAGDIGLIREQTPLMVKGMVTEPLSNECWAAAGWPRRSGVNVLSQLFYSFAPTVDCRIVYVGGYYTSAPWDRNLVPEVEWKLKQQGQEHLAAFFPAFKGAKTAQTWGGPISITPDWIPHIGQTSDPRILYACGCWGNGMPIGAQNGRTFAELVLDRRTENTDVWFVQRKKQMWPSRTLAGVLATGVIFRRRWGNRKIGKSLNPPIAFREATTRGCENAQGRD